LISLQAKHKTKEAVKGDSQFPTKEALQSRTRDLLRIRNDRVVFVHPSLKDALSQGSNLKPSATTTLFQNASVEDQRFLAKQCMRYLLLGKFDVGDGDDSESSTVGSSASGKPASESSVSSVGSTIHNVDPPDNSWTDLPFPDQDSDSSSGTNSRDPSSIWSSADTNLACLKFEAKGSVLLDYAARYWTKHYRLVQDSDGEILKDFAWELLSAKNREIWLPYLTGISGGDMGCPRKAESIALACYFGFHTFVDRVSSADITPECLYWAARNGHAICIEKLLTKAGRFLDWQSHYADALFVAIEKGHDEASICLIRHKPITINEPGPSGLTALAAAVSAGRSKVVREILSMYHVDVNVGGSTSTSALFCTITSGSVECLNLLLKDERTNVDQRDKKGRNILALACELGHVALVQAFIDSGEIDLNSRDVDQRTPLMWAVNGRQKAVVDLLSEKYGVVDMKLQDEQGRNAANFAAWKSTPEILERLLDVDPECALHTDKEGYTAFEWSLDPPEKPDNAEVFLRKFPRAFEGVAGLRMFGYALKWGAVKVAQLLISRHVFDINVKSEDGMMTALSCALQHAMEKQELGPLKAVLDVPGIDLSLGSNAMKLGAFIDTCVEGDRRELKWLLSKHQK
jgi:ankyrin repeat protein